MTSLMTNNGSYWAWHGMAKCLTHTDFPTQLLVNKTVAITAFADAGTVLSGMCVCVWQSGALCLTFQADLDRDLCLQLSAVFKNATKMTYSPTFQSWHAPHLLMAYLVMPNHSHCSFYQFTQWCLMRRVVYSSSPLWNLNSL